MEPRVKKWVEKKKEEGIDEEVLREVLSEKGYDQSDIESLLNSEKFKEPDLKFETSSADQNSFFANLGSSKLKEIIFENYRMKLGLILTILVLALLGGSASFIYPTSAGEMENQECEAEFNIEDAGYGPELFIEGDISLEGRNETTISMSWRKSTEQGETRFDPDVKSLSHGEEFSFNFGEKRVEFGRILVSSIDCSGVAVEYNTEL